MTGKASESAEELADVVLSAVNAIAETEGKKIIINEDNIKLEKKVGGGVEDSELIQGIV